MKIYTCKKTGQKFTEREVHMRRRARLQRQKRAKLVFAGSVVTALLLAVTVLFSAHVSAFDEQFENMQTVNVRIHPGQTIWSIVEELTPNHSTREVVFAMHSMNDDINFENVQAYSDIVTFYVDDSIDLSTLNHLEVVSSCQH